MLIVRMDKRNGCEVFDNNFINGMDCCPFIGRCSAYAKEMRKQSPFNAHPIDYIPDGCRIIGELPDKHGRLIDADVIEDGIMDLVCTGELSDRQAGLLFAIVRHQAPTIIEPSCH